MPIFEHATEFAGKPIEDYDPAVGTDDPVGVCYRLRLEWDDADEGHTWASRLEAFLADPRSTHVTGLVVGAWGTVAEGTDADDVVKALVAARDRLRNLRSLFVGDIVVEESEISWIVQTDLSPLFSAYPQLEHFRARGGTGLSLGTLRAPRLKQIVLESGGLPPSVLHQIWLAELPELEHLELWLGDSGYGWDGAVEDLDALLSGYLFPKLRYLGLRNSEIADEIAVKLAGSPLLERLEMLDLSLGTLGDAGVSALLDNPAVRKLKKLDIHHHYCSKAMIQRLTGAPANEPSWLDFDLPGMTLPRALGEEIEVDASEVEEPDEYDGEESRYVAVGE
jgi:hypothetical protein